MYETEFDLQRFVAAQQRDFSVALAEIRSGQKRSHWMWYVFPQVAGLGRSELARYYAIPDLDAAISYMNHPYLRENLLTITRALLELNVTNPTRVMGSPDDMKLRSCMTLFELAAPEAEEFGAVLNKFYGGKRDQRTLGILGR